MRFSRIAKLLVFSAITSIALSPSSWAQKAQLKPVTLVLEWTGFQPQHFGFWIAKERGWYADEGLDVTIKNSGGSTQAMQILTGGQAQFANVAASALVQAAGRGSAPLKMVAMFSQKDSMSMAYFESSGIKTPKNLEGRKMGLVPGSVAFLLWPSFAKANNIDISKVSIKSWDFRSYYGIFGAKQVDVAGNFTLGSTGEWLFKQRGETVRQFVFSDSVPVLGTGIVVRGDLIKSDPDLIRHFVKATQRAWAYLATDSKSAVPEAAKIVHQQFDETPAPEIIAEYAYEMIPGRMLVAQPGKPQGWSDPAEWSKMIDLLKTYDTEMTTTPTPGDVMTNDFLSK